MGIVKMKLVRISTDASNIEEVLKRCSSSSLLHAEEAIDVIRKDTDERVLIKENEYGEYEAILKNIGHSIGFEMKKQENSSNTYTKDECEQFVKNMEKKFSFLSGSENSLTKDDQIALENLRELDFKRMHESQYVTFGFGRVPQNNAKKINLVDYSKLMITTLHENAHYRWICYATSNTYVKEVKQALRALYMEEIKIPILDSKRMIAECGDEMLDVYTYCEEKSRIFELYRYVSQVNDRYIIMGFVPMKKINKFRKEFEYLDVQIDEVELKEYPHLHPPTLLKNNWFFKPFELYVEMYSLPKYRELDPTVIVGLTYCFLFGVMFGDLGQGLLLMILGLFLEVKTKNKLAGIIARIGIPSMIFGFLFGSVFGNEELLIPVHQSVFGTEGLLIHVMAPSTTMVLLLAAVGIGAFLIFMSIGINTLLNIKRKKWGEVLFSHNGLAGMIFYTYFVAAIFLSVLGSTIKLLTMDKFLLFGVLPMIAFFMKEPFSQLIEGESLTPHIGWGNFILETIFELIEILFSFVTNSLSYLRVGGFVLSHAGMMLVVMTLVEMTGSAGPLVLVLGNLFVMGLEGLIVGIQTLRLEYYEMFSRYFDGGGKKFELISAECK